MAMMKTEIKLMEIGEETGIGAHVVEEYVALQEEIAELHDAINDCDLSHVFSSLILTKKKADYLVERASWYLAAPQTNAVRVAISELIMEDLPEEMAEMVKFNCECKKGW